MDIARAVMFLCDERNSFINGENITIDGGMTKLMIYTEIMAGSTGRNDICKYSNWYIY